MYSRFTATADLQKRHTKALEIIATGSIEKNSDGDYLVQARDSQNVHTVSLDPEKCSCRDHYYRLHYCKHLQAVLISTGADTQKNSHAAYSLAARGWAVFPCVPGKKVPATPWRTNSTVDPDLISQMFKPDSNVGVDCGKSGLAVIDIDLHNGVDGLAAWDLVKNFLGLDDTDFCKARTPSGGIHIIFRDSTGELTNSNRHLPRGLDVRANGGFIVGPGSKTPTGDYHFISDVPVTEIPTSLRELLSGGRSDVPAWRD